MKLDSSKSIDALMAILRRMCRELPGSEEYIMVHHPAFRVGKKPFVIVGMDEHEKGVTLSVNLGRETQGFLLDDKRFARTPYIGQHGWVTVRHKDLRKGELDELLTASWKRVAAKKLLLQWESRQASQEQG